ncbi:hypothetical protein NQ156_10710 [Microbacterium sp. zg.Y625]|uniref:hypothetical protein n=1 Tax=Microbacterium jiangjiandongii TaxID=3049071 RepID=UPI00214C9385|nr:MULTISPECIES: hypothetical protein [unclassified Microbacterium]MCR2793532.1 hypothetical protein [Microbacterium sp. zg.Y625]WIM25886.1 hypothetical protein QNO14_02195 [Microbacterium sp. zg-Y625]
MTTLRRLTDVAFWLLAALLAGAHLVVLWQSVTVNPLWEDEAFNLTVPLNLLAGLGYTSDGTLSGSTLTPFDARISTGPVVLLPIAAVLAFGVDLVVGARLVPAAFYLALLAAVWLLGRRVGGRWAGLLAVTVPLAFDAAAPPSPIQGPADILGEVPAAALLAWALVVVQRRPWLAGLLFGLAIQTKYISLLAAPALVLAMLLSLPGIPLMRRLHAVVLPAVLALVPTAIVELCALIALGPAGFWQHLRSTVGFVRNGGQPGVTTSVPEKLATLSASWHLPAAVAAATAIAVVLLIAAAVVVVRRVPEFGSVRVGAGARVRDTAPLLVAAVVGALTFVGWWATAMHTPLWVRHPAPGLLAFVPVLFAFVVPALGVLWRAAEGRRSAPSPGDTAVAPRGARVWLVRGAIGLAAVLVATVPAAQAVSAAREALASDGAVLAHQRAIAAEIAVADAEWIATQWGGPVSLVVLAGSHVALTDAPPENIAGYAVLTTDPAACEEPVVTALPFVVCAP